MSERPYQVGDKAVVMSNDGYPAFWSGENQTCVEVSADLDQDDSKAIVLTGNWCPREGGKQLPDLFVVKCVSVDRVDVEEDEEVDIRYYLWEVVE